MDLGTILVCVVLLSILAIAVVLFIRSPDEGKFQWFSPRHQPGLEYAPEYTTKEKLLKLSIHLLWLLPLFVLFNNLLFPALHEPSGWICERWFGWPAVHWVLWLLMGSPMLLLTAACLPMVIHWWQVLRHEQHPLPEQKVFKPTPVIRGQKATNRARLVLAVIPVSWLVLLLLTFNLGQQVNTLASDERIGEFCQTSLGSDQPE